MMLALTMVLAVFVFLLMTDSFGGPSLRDIRRVEKHAAEVKRRSQLQIVAAKMEAELYEARAAALIEAHMAAFRKARRDAEVA